MEGVEEFILHCIRYESFESAVHAALCVYDSGKREYAVLIGYLLMRSGEHRRAMRYLVKEECFTAKYYLALCHQKIREYECARNLLERALKKESEVQREKSCLEAMYIVDYERTMVLEKLGELALLSGEYEQAQRYYSQSAANKLIYTSNKFVLGESVGREEENSNNMVRGDEESEGHRGSKKEKRAESEDCLVVSRSFAKSARLKDLVDAREFCDLAREIPSVPITLLSDIALYTFESGYVATAASLFEEIRGRDKYFIGTMHYYSSILWHMREKRTLGILCRDLLGIDPRSSVTWAALGNYFSLRMEHDKSITCFERSLAIKKDYYVLCLLGHELIINSDLTDGIKSFLESLKLKANNYSALAGCGLIYEKIGKLENAEYCFLRAVQSNEANVLLGYLTIQFLVSQRKLEKAYALIARYLEIEDSMQEFGRAVKSDGWLVGIKKRAGENEQMRPMLSSFLLELAQIYGMAGDGRAAERIASEVDEEGILCAAKKVKIQKLVAAARSSSPSR
jgi:tetratricopeptide (TPR) repeat protein